MGGSLRIVKPLCMPKARATLSPGTHLDVVHGFLPQLCVEPLVSCHLISDRPALKSSMAQGKHPCDEGIGGNS